MKQFVIEFTPYLILIFLIIGQSSAYTSTDGIQQDDIAIVDYRGWIADDNTEFDIAEDVEFTVSPDRLIEGFYEGLLGMKIGERKNITVPAEKGYSTGDLANETLIFDTYIEDVTCCEPTSQKSNDPMIGIETIPIFLAILIIPLLRGKLRKRIN